MSIFGTPLNFKPKIWIFDFDGVIVDSNEIKRTAHDRVLQDYPSEIKNEARSVLNQTSLSRHDKYLKIAKEIIKAPDVAKESQKLIDRYRDYTRDAVIKTRLLPGVGDFLRILNEKNIPAYIASATPEDELLLILKERKMLGWFQGAWGAPIQKPQLLKKALVLHGLEPKEAIFLGDSESDLDASLEAAIPFVGIIGHSDFKNRESEMVSLFSNLKQILRMKNDFFC